MIGYAILIWTSSVADLEGPPPVRPKIFAISCSFWENFGKIVGWCPLLEGWRPLLRGIMDPPLVGFGPISGVGAPIMEILDLPL